MALLSLAGPRTRRVQSRIPIQRSPSPVAALRALQSSDAALLEGRGVHPEARHAYIAFTPRAELWATSERAYFSEHGEEPQPLPGRPWDAISSLLERARGADVAGPAFQGGWVGFLSHEASAWMLSTPVAQPLPPARPQVPFAHFRLYADALAIDGTTGRAQIIANDFGNEDTPAASRLQAAGRALDQPPPSAPAARALDEPVRTLDPDAFERRVAQVQDWVRSGDCFQVNVTSSFAYPWSAPTGKPALISLYDEYAASNPGAWGGFYAADGFSILSSSPECLADLRGDRLRLRPIAGTRPRAGDAAEDEARARELRDDPKERAEHAMLVDLARNDAARVCKPGSVEVPNLSGIERYRHVMHLVSEVEGRARVGLTVRELLEAVFPGGTVTGAPKRRAVQRIAEVEPGPRGAYTGSLGFVSFSGATQWNLLIRTLVATPTHVTAHAGCGIVAGSRPRNESDELAAKARAQVEAALGKATPAADALVCGQVHAGRRWQAQTVRPLEGRLVLIVDHEDSFVHNLADYCERLGARTRVQSAHEEAEAGWKQPPTHLILSPGPGRPRDFPATFEHLARAERSGTPVLGVCLGHQALAESHGAVIERHAETVHGQASTIRVTSAGRTDPVIGGWPGTAVGRYHSLVARQVPAHLQTLAELADGTCMAVRVAGKPQWGFQFHPESLLTENGIDLVRAFLEVPRHD